LMNASLMTTSPQRESSFEVRVRTTAALDVIEA